MTCHQYLSAIRMLLALCLTAALLACSEPPPSSRIIAHWEGGQLDEQTYNDWIAWQGEQPSIETIRNLAMIESMADAARQRGAAGSPEVELAAEALRQRILLPALDKHLDAQVSISDDEIEQLRATYPEAFQQPKKLFLRGIFKRLPEDEASRNALVQRMQDLRAQVLRGDDLKALASSESESQSRFRDGSLGFVDPASLPQPVRQAVEHLEIGEVSALIEHADGLAFYACERIRPPSRPTTDEVRHRFRQNLFRQRRAELNQQLMTALGAHVNVAPEQDPMLIVDDYRLPPSWMNPLIRHRLPDRQPEDLSERQRRRLLLEWGQRVAMADHAEDLGLDQSEPNATAMRWRHTQALATNELRHRVDARLQPPSDDELRELFKQRKSGLRNPPAYRLAAIQFASAGDPGDSAMIEGIQDAVDRIRAGQLDFGQAAREFSVHASAGNGGLLGWLTAPQLGSIDVRLLQPLKQLGVGEDTGLLRVESGLWMVKLLEQRDATAMTFEQAREQLVEVHRQTRIETLQAAVRNRHLAEMNLKIVENRISNQ